ncbi:MAG: S9 family peptidase [Acidobacteria bacterium]|nr:S9 family peptidase [Acidobacteriota bacterium]
MNVVQPTLLTQDQRTRDRALEFEAAAVLDAFANFNTRLSPDGGKVLFLSDRSGSVQAYIGEVARPAAPAIQITDGADGLHWANFTADGGRIVFTRDAGRDENYRIYRVNLDGSNPVNLTPRKNLHRDNPVLPEDLPNLSFYTARDVSSPSTTLYALQLDDGKERSVYRDSHPSWASDVTADGSRVLLVRFIDRTDLAVLEVDAASGAARQVYPPQGERAAVYDARYDADGGRVLVATDEGREISSVLLLHGMTGVIERRYIQDRPLGAHVAAIEVSPTGDRIAVVVNAGNRSEVRFLDAETLELAKEVELPFGMVEFGGFSSDGKELAMVVATPEQPWDVYAADAAGGRLRRLRDEARPGLENLPPIDVAIERIAAFDGLSIPVNVYLPRSKDGGASTCALPTIVFLHGGPAWSYQAAWDPLARFFLGRGYAFVGPNVRGSIGFGRAYERADNREKRSDVLRDLESVNGWVKRQPWCDPDRVVVMGLSYGGYLTLMALTRQPTLWSAGVDLFGVADLGTLLASTDRTVRVALIDEFGDPERDAALLAEYSPMRDVSRITAPLFVYAGQNDPRVPRTESDQIVGALRRRGVAVEYMVAANEGHSFDHRETKMQLMVRVARFLEENLPLRDRPSIPPAE